MVSRNGRLFSFLLAIAMAAACSQGAVQLTPAGPSVLLPEGSAATSGWTASSSASVTDPPFAPGEVRGGNGRGGKTVSGVGTVANLRGFCEPGAGQAYLSFVIQGVKVVTDAATDFFISADTDIPGGCGNLRNGTKVLVVAADTANADGSYTAVTITIVDQPGGKPPSPVEGEGVVAALKGTCPSLTMVIHGYPVMTTSATTFLGGTCAALTPGTRVRVVGVLGGNSVVASSIEVLAPATP